MANARPAWAADDAVQIACPSLTTERAAELESRLRANLLTSEPAVRVLVTCQPLKTEVRVASATDELTLDVQPATVDTFRDDVLRAVEEARRLLAHRQANANSAPTAPSEAASSVPTTPSVPAPTLPPVAVSRRAPAAVRPPSLQPAASRSWIELFGEAVGEAWRGPLALGGAIGIARRTPQLWFGLRTGVLRSTAGGSDFSATEWQASAELGVQPAAGVRVALGLGPSVLFVSPHGGLTVRNRGATSALFLDAHVTRPFWFGHWAVLPDVGGRLFTRERGVRIDADERLALRGFVPQLGIGLAYRAD